MHKFCTPLDPILLGNLTDFDLDFEEDLLFGNGTYGNETYGNETFGNEMFGNETFGNETDLDFDWEDGTGSNSTL